MRSRRRYNIWLINPCNLERKDLNLVVKGLEADNNGEGNLRKEINLQ